MMNHLLYSLCLFFLLSERTLCFIQSPYHRLQRHVPSPFLRRTQLASSFLIILNDDDDDEDDGLMEGEEEEEEDEPQEEDPYLTVAASEFQDSSKQKGGDLVQASSPFLTPPSNLPVQADWGGALGKLRQRVDDVASGKSQDPSHALFRLLSSSTPNQQISSFVSTANPQVVTAMSGAVQSLLGGLATPTSGVEMIVKATGDKLGALCFQLQMTGYMFRNAEYVIALKELMKLKGSATLQDYKEAFDELDSDGSGYIERSEIKDLLDDVYDGKTPKFEVDAFLKFFDSDDDGKISWQEFERGLGSALARSNEEKANMALLVEDDDDDDLPELDPKVSGTIQIELEDGNVVEVEASEYIENLKAEARELKAALRREKGMVDDTRSPSGLLPGMQQGGPRPEDAFGGIANYIASRQGDLKALTEGISPEIVETMKLLVDFVLDGGDSGKAPKNKPKEELEMEIPSSALQQLALWQLILGYRLREAEAKGDYLKLLE